VGIQQLFKTQCRELFYDMRVYITEQKRGVTKAIKRELRRCAAVEPVIGHMKNDHRMDRNYLIGSHGGAANAVLAAVGYNFRRLATWLRKLLRALFLLLFATRPNHEVARRTQSA
jgi:transposase, IS5 family